MQNADWLIEFVMLSELKCRVSLSCLLLLWMTSVVLVTLLGSRVVCSSRGPQQQQQKQLVVAIVYLTCALPAAAWLYGYGYRYRYRYTVARQPKHRPRLSLSFSCSWISDCGCACGCGWTESNSSNEFACSTWKPWSPICWLLAVGCSQSNKVESHRIASHRLALPGALGEGCVAATNWIAYRAPILEHRTWATCQKVCNIILRCRLGIGPLRPATRLPLPLPRCRLPGCKLSSLPWQICDQATTTVTTWAQWRPSSANRQLHASLLILLLLLLLLHSKLWTVSCELGFLGFNCVHHAALYRTKWHSHNQSHSAWPRSDLRLLLSPACSSQCQLPTATSTPSATSTVTP